MLIKSTNQIPWEMMKESWGKGNMSKVILNFWVVLSTFKYADKSQKKRIKMCHGENC